MRFEDRCVLVTGASRGIGRALCGQLAAAGARVLAVARDRESLSDLAAELGPAVQTMCCDLTDPQKRQELISDVISGGAPIDGLINNAGLQIKADYALTSNPDLAADIALEAALNLEAPAHLCAALLRPLSVREGAFMVNVTSALALHPKADAPVYCATKAGLRSFTRALRYQAQAALPGLLVSECILPLVDTGMTAGRGRGKISAEAAAAGLLRGLARGQTEIWVGKAGMLRWINRAYPGLAARILRG